MSSKKKPAGTAKGTGRDWIRIRNEYASTEISLRGLAEKYEIPLNTIRDRSKREGWVEFREEQRHRIGAETAQKTAETVATEEAGRVARLLRIADKIMDRTEQALDELDRQAVKRKQTMKVVANTIDPETGEKQHVETTNETLDIVTISAPIDRLGLQQISNSAKAVKDILTTTTDENDTGSLDGLIAAIKEIGGGQSDE